jgi:hypothetical protein
MRRRARFVGRRFARARAAATLPAILTTPAPAMPASRPARLLAPIAAALLAAAGLVAGASHAAGIDIHAGVDAADVGLPVYPGAAKHPEDGGGEDDLSLGLWGSAFGVKVLTVNYRSRDEVDQVSAFYRDALRAFGPVLDCSAGAPRAPRGPASGPKALDCGDDHPAAGVRLYKSGSPQDQRIVEVKPLRRGANFRLTRVQTHGLD